ncbi:ABC transporter permease [Pullulanibacillus camelliae]|uniref:ABC transporter permease n=1 Tax=Pullulanibacillus camelliae TaxID=1707096 RepID=A0A8J2VJM4_9BACL|nr:sugar ABC transporter permease [Pullulanibacillus camelliae]GGE27840.1 ABC transporter permease [Pullulanibacillus camelliae]
MISSKWTPYLFLLPAIVGLGIFSIYPAFQAFFSSLYSFSFVNQTNQFVGLQNYISEFTDPVFWNSVKVTLLFNVVINPLQIVLAFGLAILLNKRVKGIGFFRSIHFIPISVSLPIASVLFMIILNPDEGLVNSVLTSLGFHAQPFLHSSHQALWVIVGIATWKGVGYWAVFLLAGLQEVPSALYEAAALDGANKWTEFIKITFPLMKRSLTFVAVADTVANFLLFAPMYIMTDGGPNNSTDVLMYETIKNAYVNSNMGSADALIVMLIIIILIIIGVESKLLKPKH